MYSTCSASMLECALSFACLLVCLQVTGTHAQPLPPSENGMSPNTSYVAGVMYVLLNLISDCKF